MAYLDAKSIELFMDQHIGALLDKIMLIGFGVSMLFVSPKILGKDLSPEERKKRMKLVRICGILAIVGGIASLLMLF